MHDDAGRFTRAIGRFEAAHREDPEDGSWNDEVVPRAVAYHRRVVGWVERLDADAHETVRLAAWCQHIRRWTVAREDFPDGLTGYKQWRSKLAFFHADQAAEILRDVGYDDGTITRVRDLLTKKRLRSDPEVQLLEDAVCLAFLEGELEAFADKHADDKVVPILQKTWDKMGARGRAAALELAGRLPARARGLIERAVAGA